MKAIRHLPTAVAVLAAVICATGWYMTANAGDERDFDSCRRSDGVLTLTYTHRPGQEISISRKPQGDGNVTVSYRVKSTDGPHLASSVTGTITLDDLNHKVVYPDGRELKCNEAEVAP